MKKHRICCGVLLAAAAAMLLDGCGDDGDYSRYVTLGEYKNLSVELSVAEITDEELGSIGRRRSRPSSPTMR